MLLVSEFGHHFFFTARMPSCAALVEAVCCSLEWFEFSHSLYARSCLQQLSFYGNHLVESECEGHEFCGARDD